EGVRPVMLCVEELIRRVTTDENLAVRCLPDNLAYVIYTSGSTGQPKGAMVEQRGMLNHLYEKIRVMEIDKHAVVAQTASQCFDISVWQFLAALLVGGRVLILDDETARDPWKLATQVEAGHVTIWETVPSLLRMVLDTMESGGGSAKRFGELRWMVATGEALPPELCRRWLSRFAQIPVINAYGPTECSDDVTHHLVVLPPSAAATRIPIGRPIGNMRMYVLDRYLMPVPTGVAGELYVAGVGVGRGYLHDMERTGEVFVPDPFATVGGARMYRTGDLVRYLPEGELEFLRRMDDQVKVRGFRIELGEVEAALAQHPFVRDSVVVTWEDERHEKQLVAYVVPDEHVSLSAGELRAALKAQLPDYMVPTAFVQLDELPLTPNGKLDRKALPEPVGAVADSSDYVEPRNQVEEKLAEIWAELLKTERVGIHDNFFNLGGHSLLAMMTLSRVREALQVELPLRRLFEEPTVAGLAVAVAQEQASSSGLTNTITRVVSGDEEQLLPQMDQLSDEQVDLILSKMLTNSEVIQ
ncbi:MAG: non-ribosomal peptide synthetase, partial [Pyrinomonadaceae bacterium]